MKDLKFIEGNPPPEYRKEFEPYLFNTTRHRAVQSEGSWLSFHLLNEDKKQIVASLHFHIAEHLAESPLRAPFGAAEFPDTIEPEALFRFLEQAELRLKENGIREIYIKTPPQAYQPQSSVMSEALLINSGYVVSVAEINVSIDIGRDKFDDLIDAWELRKLKQSRNAKLMFMPLPLESIKEIYSFILGCREERGQSLSMSLEEVEKTVGACKGDFLLFGVYQNSELIAASIAIKVSETILYNFYSAHLRKADSLSPVVMLTEGLYDWCKKQNFKLLDLGTSALGDSPNFGLLDFKLRLGGKASIRYSYKKDLV